MKKKLFLVFVLLLSCLSFFAVLEPKRATQTVSAAEALTHNSVEVDFDAETAEIGTYLGDLASYSNFNNYNAYGVTENDYLSGNGTMELAIDPTNPTNKVLYIDNVAGERENGLWANNFVAKNATISFKVYLETLENTTHINFYARSTDQKSYFESDNLFVSFRTNPDKNGAGRYHTTYRHFAKGYSWDVSDYKVLDVDALVGQWTELTVDFSDDMIKCYVNGELYLTTEIPHEYDLYDASGYFGMLIFAQRMYIDDIKFTAQDDYRVDCSIETEGVAGAEGFIGGSISRNRYTSRSGGSVSLSATAQEGFEFVGYYQNGSLLQATSDLTLDNIASDIDLVAKFKPKYYRVGLIATDAKNQMQDYGGKVFGANLEAETYSVLTITQNADVGFVFAGWYVDNELISQEEQYEYKVQPHEIEIRAVFVPNTTPLLTLSVGDKTILSDGTVNHLGGTVVGGGQFYEGVPVNLQAAVNDGFQFDGWFFDDVLISEEEVYTFYAEKSGAIIGAFSPKKYRVEIYNGVSQSLSYEDVEYNTVIHLSYVLPNAGYTFGGWTCTAESYTVNADNSIDVLIQGEGVIVKAQYVEQMGKVSVKTNDSRAGKVIGAGTYSYGERVSIRVQINDGYVLKGISCTGANVTYEDGMLSFDMPSENVQIDLEFTSEVYVVLADEIMGAIFWLAVIGVLTAVIVIRLNKKKE